MANDRNWGGKRAGAGRKPGKRTSRNVPHRPRFMPADSPYKAALTLQADVDRSIVAPILRREEARIANETVGVALPIFNVRLRGRTIYFESIASPSAFSKHAQRFASRIARRINSIMGRRGKVFRDRYRVLSPVYVPPPPLTFREKVLDHLKALAFVAAAGAMTVATGPVMRTRPYGRGPD